MNADRASYNAKLEKIPGAFHNRVVRYFPDTDLRNGHDGLTNLAQKNGIKIKDLPWGEFLIFMNTSQTMLKMFSQGGVICHLKMPGRTKIDPRTIALIPRFFNGTYIQYSKALEKVIMEDFGVKLI